MGYLTPAQIAYAIKRNPYWKTTLGSAWAGDHISSDPVDSAAFAEDTALFQQAHALVIDGVCGANTNKIAAYHHSPLGYDYILIDGKQEPCNFKVISEGDPGALVFTHGYYNEPLVKPDLFVNHWDAAQSSRDCYDILCRRNLSILFMGDTDGTIYQGVDPAKATCWHAGTVNRRAWGVEWCNPVYLKYQSATHPRPVVPLGVRGDQTKILGFYDEQLAAAVKLNHWVCEWAGIPKQLPAFKGKPGVVADSYIRGPGETWNVMGFKGVIAHYHQDNLKIDCGLLLWDALIKSGFKIVEVE
jgi:hypothetical protein